MISPSRTYFARQYVVCAGSASEEAVAMRFRFRRG